MSGSPLRVVVCGTKFGQVYLQAFAGGAAPFELAGVVARGSARSQACAEHYGVPLFTSPEEVPDDVDAACVVVRGGLLGGSGAELARAFMERGVHVLEEHPLHHDELAENLRCARRNGVVYRLNTFYVHQEPVLRFLAVARELFARRRPLYVDAAAGFQLAYSLLDIVCSALGRVRPWGFAPEPTLDGEALGRLTDLDVPFRGLGAVLGGVPCTVRVQNQMDPADPDNYAHLLHRVTLGTEAGSLTLVATHGPTVWTPRPDFPRDVREHDARPHFGEREGASPRDHLDAPSGLTIGPPEAPGYRAIFESSWPAGVRRALADLQRAIAGGENPLVRGQYYLSLCEVWQDLTSRLGPPELLEAAPPLALGPEDVDALAAAGAAVDARPVMAA